VHIRTKRESPCGKGLPTSVDKCGKKPIIHNSKPLKKAMFLGSAKFVWEHPNRGLVFPADLPTLKAQNRCNRQRANPNKDGHGYYY
jgi:hypothetical protein